MWAVFPGYVFSIGWFFPLFSMASIELNKFLYITNLMFSLSLFLSLLFQLCEWRLLLEVPLFWWSQWIQQHSLLSFLCSYTIKTPLNLTILLWEYRTGSQSNRINITVRLMIYFLIFSFTISKILIYLYISIDWTDHKSLIGWINTDLYVT